MKSSHIIGYTLVEDSPVWIKGQRKKKILFKPDKQEHKFPYLKLVFYEDAPIRL
jgi:hypothetical protein